MRNLCFIIALLSIQLLYAQTEADREKYPLYHDARTDELRPALKKLVAYEPYISNNELKKHIENLDEKITRYNIGNYVDDFKFFLTLDITEDFLEKKFSNLRRHDDVWNIKHIAAHALADYYLSAGEYDQAVEYYKKSVFDYRLIVASSGTTLTKDIERCIFDIANTYYKAGKKDQSYAYLIALIVESQNYSHGDRLSEYLEKDKADKKKLKTDIDKALKTIKKGKDGTYVIIFRGHEAIFFPFVMGSTSPQKLAEKMKNSDFYKELN
ncbi:MAG: hypothetical protein LBV71_06830 [Prevotella sp.]|jgi:tetratricopeptide (TPR) repeat protein|nr:hypothetical protein [Prevotella sp.]